MQTNTPSQAEEISFQDLPSIPTNIDQQTLLSQIQTCLTNSNFTERIKGVNILRAVNKQFPSDAEFMVKTFLQILAQILNGPKTIEHKTVFIFFQEVLANEPALGLGPETVSELQGLICQKSITGKGFIKDLAKELLMLMTRRCNIEGMLYSLMVNSGNKNMLIAELSIKHFVKVLRRKEIQGRPAPSQQIQGFSKELFFMLFKGLSLNLKAKRIKLINPSEAGLLFFLNALGQEKFVYIIELMVAEGQIPPDFKEYISTGVSNAQKRAEQRKAKALKKQQDLTESDTRKVMNQSNIMNTILSQVYSGQANT
jgi:hypothetical protein